MRLFISGSAPFGGNPHAFEARTSQRILERYRMTETNMIKSNPQHGERRAGTVGMPLHSQSMCLSTQNSPANTMGKVQKNILRDQYENTFS